MRLIVVVGARPNFIKVGPLMPTLARAGIDAGLAHTGQHYDKSMSDIFFSDLDIPEPRWNLAVGSGTHAVQTGSAMMRLEELFTQERPDAVMVVGDVNSTLAGALAAVKLQIPVVHLEAGLRSGDMAMPEEVNRLVTDRLSSMLLAPTEDSMANLEREGCGRRRIHFVGNIMAESVLLNLGRIDGREVAQDFGLEPGGFILTTLHRPENTDHPEKMAHAVAAFQEAPLPVLIPAHPRARPALIAAGAGEGTANLHVIDPVGYLDMLALQRDAAVIVTDSGGVQEEACMLRTPCVTIRRNTERRVTLDVGANRLVDTDREAILGGIDEALHGKRTWSRPKRWDEAVSHRICKALEQGIIPPEGY